MLEKLNNLKFYILLLVPLMIYCTNDKNVKPIENNKKMKQFHIVVNYNLPFEILVNDIVVIKDLNNGLQGAENISLYFNDSNLQKIKVRFFPDLENNIKTISPSSISKQETVIYITENDSERKFKDLVIPSIKESVPYYEYEWSIDFESIKGIDNLSKSQDLAKIDKDKLQNEVLNKYEELRKLLNEGKGKEFMKEIETAKTNLFIAENMSREKQQEYNTNLEEYFDSHKGTLLAIGNFTLKIMGNGRAVALEYATGKYKGLGILSSEDIPNNTLNNNYIILHKPIGADKFEIFRYNCSYTSLK